LQFTSCRSRSIAYAATLAVVLLASSSPAVTRLSLTHDLGALDLVLLRCGIGGLLFLPFLLASWRRLPRKLVMSALVLAFLHGWGMHLTAIAGLRFAPAGHASALGPGFVPVWVMLWRRLGYGAQPDWLEVSGLGLIALGALVLVGHASWSLFENETLFGDLLFLLSSCLASAYLVYVQQHEVDPMQATALVAVYSGIVGGLLLLASPMPSALWTASTSEVLVQASFQGIGMGACAVLFASYATRHLGSQRVAVFIAAIPVLSLLFGWTIVGDGISPYEATAAVLVGAGIVVAGFLAGKGSAKQAPIHGNEEVQFR
jgi:drug/metabolite transporter (DMT)-like permease